MTARRKTPLGAAAALCVAALGLVTALFAVLTAGLQVLAAGLRALAARLQAPAAKRPQNGPTATPQGSTGTPQAPPARPNLRVVPAPAPDLLEYALVGLGFKPADVRRFVATLGPRAKTEPLADLVKEGLRALAA